MKEENIKGEYQRKVDKSLIPTCNIMGVNIAAINMNWLLKYLDENLSDIKGDYICVSNVHTTVTSYEDAAYCAVQNGGLMAIPDGGPLSSVGRKRGYSDMDRTTGPSLMGEIFKISAEKGYRHYFYGSTEETLKLLEEKLQANYPGIQIAGMYSPPFRPLTEEEDKNIIENINKTKPDFVWRGLGAPKQEKWMAEHQGKIDGLMLGVGAGFDYYAENIKRAPMWMQKSNLEWLYRLMQDPKRLFKRYFHTNTKFIWNLDVEIAYAYQELNELPEGVELPAGRTKPWGTGQAVLACKEVLHEPFAVINADDYYGKEAFVKLHDFLVGYTPEKANQFCMAGFILKNTLSENGAVTRGICETNEEGYLTAVHETSNIVKTPEGAAVDNDGQLTSINAESYASMNMWGLTPEFMQTLEDGFKEFFANMGDKDILKAEYLLPIYIDELLQAGRVSVKVLDTNDKWFGVTYKEDKDYVVKSFAKLIENGVYQRSLFEDLI